jgi:hypothetical protein
MVWNRVVGDIQNWGSVFIGAIFLSYKKTLAKSAAI